MGVPTEGIPSQGVHGKLWVASALPFNATAATCIPFQNESLTSAQTNYHPDNIRGSRSRPRENRRAASVAVSGSITCCPSKTDLRFWLARILGTAETGSGTTGAPWIYTLAETIPEWQALIRRVLGSLDTNTREVFLAEGCVINSATFSATQAGPLQLTLNVEAKRETPYADGSITNGSIDTGVVISSGSSVPTSDPPNESCFMLHDTGHANGNMKLGGVDRAVFEWSLTINNLLDTGRFMNSLYRTRIPSQGLDVQMSATLGTTSAEDDLENLSINSASPDMNDNEIRFYQELGTNDDVLSFLIGTWNVENRTPALNGKGERVLQLSGPVDAKYTSTAKREVEARLWTT